MPIIEIRSLPPRAQGDVSRAVKNVSWELAKILGVPADAVKAVWTPIAPEHYAEGGNLATEQSQWTHAPIVTLTAMTGRPQELIEKALGCAAECLAKDLSLPVENVLVWYNELPSGRLLTKGAFKR